MLQIEMDEETGRMILEALWLGKIGLLSNRVDDPTERYHLNVGLGDLKEAMRKAGEAATR